MSPPREPLALVGMACRFPGGADTPPALWRLLEAGVDAIGPIPADRWNAHALFHQDFAARGRLNVVEGGFIEGIDRFDSSLFGISPVEAERMDPQQRLLLECAFRAFEDAGLPLDSLAGGPTGVFVGISTHDYADILQSADERVNIGPHTNTGTASSIAANRISYVFDLRGPSLAVDTACSSSLSALHLACESIWRGECGQALVGGVNAILKPEPHIGFTKGGFLSPDARCMAFDVRANGYVRSEGVGAVVLKPLARALADGDRIYAEVLGTAVNQDGRSDGLAAPNLDAQVELLHAAYARAGVVPAAVGHVQAHGTGTKVGDRTEALALGQVLGSARPRDGALVIGSVKTNIGHLEAASGIAGLIATTLALVHRKIPGNIHFREPSAEIPLASLGLEVPGTLREWPGERLIAGVNSFGFGGSNAHAVLASHKAAVARPARDRLKAVPPLLTLSASRRSDVAAIATGYAEWLEREKPDLDCLCFNANQRRTRYRHRWTIPAGSPGQLRSALARLAQDPDASGGEPLIAPTKVAFVFSGQGSQWWGMARRLLADEPAFREAVVEIDALFEPLAGMSIVAELMRAENDSRIGDTTVAQPTLFAVQMALARVWELLGVRPTAVLGHSVGEVAAACVSGALSLAQGVRVIYERSRIQGTVRGLGKMLAIGMGHEQAAAFLRAAKGVCIAAVNGPAMVTAAGPTAAVERLVSSCSRDGIFHRMLDVDVPFHSAVLDPLKPRLREALASLEPGAETLALYSSVTAARIHGGALDASYWCDNMREPVLFAAAFRCLLADGCNAFVEIGPHPVLGSSMTELVAEGGQAAVIVPSLRRNEDDAGTLNSSLARLWESGAAIDWAARYDSRPALMDLPAYPMHKERYWLETANSRAKRTGSLGHPLIAGRTDLAHERRSVWHVNLDPALHPFVRDHRVQGPIVYPGTGQIELALTAGLAIWSGLPGTIRDIELKSPVFLPDEGAAPVVQVEILSEDGKYALSSRPAASGSAWTVHSTGRIVPDADVEPRERLDLEAVKARLTGTLDPDALCDQLRAGGLQLGPAFRSTRRIWLLATEALVEIGIPEPVSADATRYQIHPVMLDAALQMTAAAAYERKSERELYLPIAVKHVVYYRKPTPVAYAHVFLTHHDALHIETDTHVVDAQGDPVVSLYGIRYRYIAGTRDEPSVLAGESLHEFAWIRAPRPEERGARSGAGALPAPGLLREALAPLCSDIRARPLADRYHRAFEPELDCLCDEYILEALQALAVRLHPGDEVAVSEVVAHGGVASQRVRVLKRLLEILALHGRLDRTGDGRFTVPAKAAVARRSAELWSDLRARFPEFAPELQLLARTGPGLAGVLTGSIDPVGVLFPQNDWQSVADFYAGAYAFAPYNELMACAFTRVVAALPAERALRVLEIGAGTGGMTRAVLPLLPAERTEYVFTDLSAGFFPEARERLADYPFVSYRTLDLERDPEDQGFNPSSFDVIVASDVLHATSDIEAVLSRVGRLLVPGGLLAVLEVTSAPTYIDLTFGLTDGWWTFRDHALRPASPLMTQSRWSEVLGQERFSDVAAVSDAIDRNQSAQTLFFARSAALAPAEPLTPVAPRDVWLMFPDRHGVCAGLGKLLAAGGAEVVTVPEGTALRDLRAPAVRRKRIAGVVFGAGLQPEPPVEGAAASDEQTRLCGALVEIYRRFATEKVRPGIWILTAGAVAVDGTGDVTNPYPAALWGMARGAMTECPDMQTVLLDLPPRAPAQFAGQVYAELCSAATDEERALREAGRYVRVLRHLDPEESERRAVRQVPGRGGSYRLRSVAGTGIENLHLREVPSLRPGKGEVLLEIHAAGLNFKDVMNATGLLSDEAVSGGRGGKRLGLECSGVVREVGEGVRGIAAGNRVMAAASDCLGGQVVVDARHVLALPPSFTMEEAAGVPVVYLTAYYALSVLSRLRAGEKVLIHSAAGGVGLAAVRIARAIGAEVYASVGNDEKAAFLRNEGVRRTISSRKPGFAGEIRRLTNGVGVDVVLNSLAADAIPEGIDCLAPFGRFVEIGKTDIYRDRQIGLRMFGQNLSYFAVDVDRLLAQKPELAGELFRDVVAFIGRHGLKPHPTAVVPVEEAGRALRGLAQGRHIGKVVLAMPATAVTVRPPERVALARDGAYLVTGGTSGFGLAVAQWLADNGAGLVALMSRSGRARPEDRSALERLLASGCRVELVPADVANARAVAEAIRRIDGTGFALRGVFHCAMVLDDAPLLDLDARRFARVLDPKVAGAWNLHAACTGKQLDHFVMFSSMAAVYGNAGQANYAAANTVLDSFAPWLRARGVRALSIAWGAIGDTGFVARNDKVHRILDSQGWRQLPVAAALEVLASCLRQGAVNAVALLVDWTAFARFFPVLAASPRFSQVVRQAGRGSGVIEDAKEIRLLEALRRAPAAERHARLSEGLAGVVARVLGLAPHALDETESLQRLGFDSLMATQLSSWIRAQLDLDYSMMKIMRVASVRDLAGELLNELRRRGGEGGGNPL